MRRIVHDCKSDNAGVRSTTVAETPVAKVIRLFGLREAARLVDRTEGAIRKWNRRKSAGGCGGLVPSEHQLVFLREARERGLPLKADDFIAEVIR